MLDITLTNSSIGFPTDESTPENDYTTRHCVRVIVYREDGTIALSKERLEELTEFYGLPGGGIDQGESEEEALIRETKEEVGCTITSRKKIGLVKAVKGYNKRTTYHNTYVAAYGHDLGKYELTEHEKTYVEGIVRVSIDQALSLIERCMKVCKYEKGKFILTRDREILAYVKNNISL